MLRSISFLILLSLFISSNAQERILKPNSPDKIERDKELQQQKIEMLKKQAAESNSDRTEVNPEAKLPTEPNRSEVRQVTEQQQAMRQKEMYLQQLSRDTQPESNERSTPTANEGKKVKMPNDDMNAGGQQVKIEKYEYNEDGSFKKRLSQDKDVKSPQYSTDEQQMSSTNSSGFKPKVDEEAIVEREKRLKEARAERLEQAERSDYEEIRTNRSKSEISDPADKKNITKMNQKGTQNLAPIKKDRTSAIKVDRTKDDK